jgi:hypothetical protein
MCGGRNTDILTDTDDVDVLVLSMSGGFPEFPDMTMKNILVMCETVSVTSVNIYQATRRYIPEDISQIRAI